MSFFRRVVPLTPGRAALCPVLGACALALIQTGARASAGKALELATGSYHTCALLADHSVKCWGYNEYGQLGLGDQRSRGGEPADVGAGLPRVELGSGRTAVAIAAGNSFSCALLDNATVKCWGFNGYGALGVGDRASRGIQPGQMGANLPAVELGGAAIAITAGSDHACALLADHHVKCWGYNAYGQLGTGDSVNRGEEASQMGAALLSVPLGANRSVLQISAGYSHTCALLDDHSVKCWGSNQNGQLGLGDTVDRGGKAGQMGDALPSVDLGAGHRAQLLAAGGYHNCVLLEDSSVRCWGFNTNGQLGLGDAEPRGSAAGQMGSLLQAADLEPGLSPSSLSCGMYHCCAIFSTTRTAKCWGYNGNGQLGVGDQVDRGSKANQMGTALPFMDLGPLASVQGVYPGDIHTCAVLTDGSVKCWGYNGDGELGLGDTKPRGGSADSLGSALPDVEL